MKIYEEGLEEHPKITIIFGNFMMLLWLALGTGKWNINIIWWRKKDI